MVKVKKKRSGPKGSGLKLVPCNFMVEAKQLRWLDKLSRPDRSPVIRAALRFAQEHESEWVDDI